MRHWGPLVFGLLATTPSLAMADNLTEYYGPRELATGETMRGAALAASSTLLNPAGLSMSKQFAFEGTVGIRRTAGALITNIVACDSTVALPGCYYYRYFTDEPEVGDETFERSVHEGGVTLARALTKEIHLGVTGRYFKYSSTVIGDDNASGFGLDAGLAIKPTDVIQVGVAGYSLLSEDSSQYPRAVGTGIVLNPSQMFRIGADGVWNFDDDDDSGRYSGGAEYFIRSGTYGYPLRAGVIYDSSGETTQVTGGVGFLSTVVGIDIGVSYEVDGGDELIVQAGLRVFGPS